jgi:hypothetical protein
MIDSGFESSVKSVVMILLGPMLRGLRTQIRRTSDDLRTQNAARFRRLKLCPLIDLRPNIKTFGRFGRKFPEHFFKERSVA